jgi:cysteine synthase A
MGDDLPCGWPYADPDLGFQGMCDKVEQLRKELPNVHVLDQATNKANSEAHFRLTGMDVWL